MFKIFNTGSSFELTLDFVVHLSVCFPFGDRLELQMHVLVQVKAEESLAFLITLSFHVADLPSQAFFVPTNLHG